MADVTDAPVPTGASEFDVPGDLGALADHFGGLDMYSRANAAALPSTDNWEGRQLLARDTRIVYVWTSVGWERLSTAPWGRLAKSSSQSTHATANTLTGVIWDTDLGSWSVWASGNPTRIRLNRVGLWRVSASLRAASTIYGRIRLNGSGGADTEIGGTYVSPEDLILCTNPASDYVEVMIQATSASVALVDGFNSARAVYLG